MNLKRIWDEHISYEKFGKNKINFKKRPERDATGKAF